MEVFSGEDVNHFVDNILHKLVCALFTKAQNILIYAPAMAHFVGTTRTTQFGISSQSSQRVTGHIYFGDNSDMALTSIFHDVASLLLGVEATMRDAIIHSSVMTDYRSRAH